MIQENQTPPPPGRALPINVRRDNVFADVVEDFNGKHGYTLR